MLVFFLFSPSSRVFLLVMLVKVPINAGATHSHSLVILGLLGETVGAHEPFSLTLLFPLHTVREIPVSFSSPKPLPPPNVTSKISSSPAFFFVHSLARQPLLANSIETEFTFFPPFSAVGDVIVVPPFPPSPPHSKTRITNSCLLETSQEGPSFKPPRNKDYFPFCFPLQSNQDYETFLRDSLLVRAGPKFFFFSV